MSSYVVLTGSEKHDIVDADVVGPFADDKTAEAWVARLPNAEVLGPESPWSGEVLLRPPELIGGYAGFAIVSDDTAKSPDVYLASWIDDLDD